jgi:outer membrane protein assembly factor BamB
MMTHNNRPARALERRTALLLPLGVVAGCSLFEDWFSSESKTPLPGKRVAIMEPKHGFDVDPGAGRVVLPPPVANADWPQAGGNASHAMGHLAGHAQLTRAWRADIGEGGGYREKITARPVIAGRRVFTMDSDAVVSTFDLGSGRREWRVDTQADEDRSSNVGGGLSVDGATLYASTGRGELLALDAASGRIRWRKSLGTAARSAPTLAEGKVFVATLGHQVMALAADDGRRLWAHQAGSANTAVLGLPAPAYSDGLVVAGFASGDLVALRAASGAVAWTDNLGAGSGRNSLVDLSSVRGMPVIQNGRVFAVSLGGLMVSLNLRSGRRLWEREVASSETPWVAGDWAFILSTDQHLVALTANEGRIAWLKQLPTYGNMEKREDPIRWLGPLLAGERLIVASSGAALLAVSPYSGEILGQQDLPGPISVAPIAAGGTVFLVTDDATLTALR